MHANPKTNFWNLGRVMRWNGLSASGPSRLWIMRLQATDAWSGRLSALSSAQDIAGAGWRGRCCAVPSSAPGHLECLRLRHTLLIQAASVSARRSPTLAPFPCLSGKDSAGSLKHLLGAPDSSGGWCSLS